jgi:hypothetical protein
VLREIPVVEIAFQAREPCRKSAILSACFPKTGMEKASLFRSCDTFRCLPTIPSNRAELK